jgi:hypothetical protein
MKILKSKIFHPTQWVVRKKSTFRPEILNPPTWREKQINNAKIDREYESLVKAEGPVEIESWVDKYNKVTN